MTKSKLLAVVSLILFASGSDYVRGGENDLGILDPITPVGEITPVGPMKRARTPDEKLRALGENKYVACWTWDTAEEKKWRCTKTYGDPKAAYEFTEYQNKRYGTGQAIFVAVDAKSWQNPELRKKMMDRFQQEIIPSALERVAEKANGTSTSKAELLRLRSKQVKLILPEWVDVKPELPKGVKLGDAKPSLEAGYHDEALGIRAAGTNADPTASLVGVWTGEFSVKTAVSEFTEVRTVTLKQGGTGQIDIKTTDPGQPNKTYRDGILWDVSDGRLRYLPDVARKQFKEEKIGGLWTTKIEIKDSALVGYKKK